MSVPLTGTGSYFVRLGDIIGEFNRAAAVYGTPLELGFQSIWAQFASSDQAAVAPLPAAVAQYAQSGQTYLQALQSCGQQASILQVGDDTSVVPATYAQSVTVLVGQMVGAGQTVQRPTLTSTVTAGGSNLGSTVVRVSTTNKYGDQLDMILAETVTVTCTGSSPAYGEPLAAVGAAAVAGTSPDWPAGSGANLQLSVTNAANATLVTDGGFENWTGTGNNTPVSWAIADGDAGVTVFRGTSVVRGSFSAQITSDGAQPTQLAQTVAVAVNVVYAVAVWAKISSADGSGVFVMQMTDGDGNVLQNDAGADLSYTRNMSAQVTTSYQCFTAFFSTPRQLPVTTQIRYGFDTAPAAAKSLFLDLGSVTVAPQLYAGGPYITAISGADPTALGDTFACAFTNSLTSQSFVRGSDRVFSFRTLGLAWPSANSPTLSDSLVSH